MSNLGLLVKNTLVNETGINKLKHADKKEKTKAIGMAIVIILSMVILAGYGFMLCYYLSEFLLKTNQMDLLLIMGVIGCTFATLFTSLYKASSYLFQSKDYDMLASLPIKQSTILTSKILMLILNNYLFAGAFILIPGIVYFIKVDTSFTYIPFLIVLSLVVPLIPILISSLVAFIITNISSRSKKNNLVSILLNIGIVILVMIISFNIQNVVISLAQNSSSIIDLTKKLYLPAYYFVDALKNGNLVSFLTFLIMSLLPTALFVYLFANNFNKINSKLSETYKSNNYKFEELKSSKPIRALLDKEFKRYLSSTVYVINSSIGMVLLLIFTVSIILVGYDKIAQLLEIAVVVDMIKIQILGIIAFCVIMTNTSAVSISLEGKNLWILKSSPIEEIDIFKSKIYLNLMLTVPVSVLCLILIAFKLDFGIVSGILGIVSIVLLAILSSTLGLYINLLYPKLEFTSDVAVVKQSASVILSLLTNLIYIVVLVGIGYILKLSNINIFLLVSSAITLIAIIVVCRLLKTKGVKIFRML